MFYWFVNDGKDDKGKKCKMRVERDLESLKDR